MKSIAAIFFLCTLLTTGVRAQKSPDTCSVRVGDYKISLLSEGQQENEPRILRDAPDEVLTKYIPTGKYRAAVNAFLVQGPEGNILIDAGFGRHLFDNLKLYGLTPEDISLILLTHMHGDHIGGLLKEGEIAFPHAKLFIPYAEYLHWNSSDNAGAKMVLEQYKEKIETFTPYNPEEIDPTSSLVPIEAFGHTPGHTVYLFVSKKEKLLIWGDLMHAMAIQMPHPEISATYDMDPEMAAEARENILKFVSEQKIPVAGMHLPFPAIGRVEKEGEGYRFVELPVNR